MMRSRVQAQMTRRDRERRVAEATRLLDIIYAKMGLMDLDANEKTIVENIYAQVAVQEFITPAQLTILRELAKTEFRS